jgi:dimethylamine/trimethylamine dehydrogenase
VSPSIEGRLWSAEDIPAHVLVVESIHARGALAGIELVYNAPRPNHVSRLPPAGVRSAPVIADTLEPTWCRAMDAHDIADVRRWHANAARRAREAGYDLVYCYAGHGLTLAQHFLSRHTNDRTGSYGGALENRARFLRVLIGATRDAIGPECALPVRIAVDEGEAGLERAEIEDVIAMLDPLVDLWDFCMSSWPADSQTARFASEGYQDAYVRGLKALSAKPVVGVGRFTSPETMRAQVQSGALDFIGAARPLIADPLLPRKIFEGRFDDIRECIGCNICVA